LTSPGKTLIRRLPSGHDSMETVQHKSALAANRHSDPSCLFSAASRPLSIMDFCKGILSESLLGSSCNPECRIDYINQSGSVLSGAGRLSRSRRAIDSVNKRLVRRDVALIQLRAPPI